MATSGHGKLRPALARRRVLGIPAAALALAVLAAGCGAASAQQARGSASAAHHAHATVHATAHGATPGTNAAAPARSCPAAVFARMTVAQRVGQLFLVGLPGNQVTSAVASSITLHHYGSAVFGTDSTGGIAGARRVADAVQALASGPATANVRFFVAANQEGGEVQALQGSGFSSIPTALAQGQAKPSSLQQLAAAWGRQMRSAGVNLNLAPVLDVVPSGTDAENAPIGALQREFGHDPSTVASHGVAFLRGMASAGVATTAKHFPGLGRVRGNTDFTSSVVDTVTTASDPYLQTYQAAVNAGVPMVMVALATYTRIDPQHLAVFSTRVMNGILRQQMHFRGVIVSDDMGAAAAVATISPASRAIGFVSAGGDLITSESLTVADDMDSAILSRAAANATFRGDVNAAVMRVLAAKQAYGLLPCVSS